MAKIKRLYLDTETTGLDPVKCGLTQVAFVIEIDGDEQMSGNFNIRPFEGAEITAKALKVTGKTYDEVMSYPDEEEVFNTFIEMLKSYIRPAEYGDDYTLIAYNAEFDQNFLMAWFDRMGKKYSNYINYRKVDPLAFLRILHVEGVSNLQSYKLSGVYKVVFNEEFNAHEADADIKATIRLYKWLVGKYLHHPRKKDVKETRKQLPHTEDTGK